MTLIDLRKTPPALAFRVLQEGTLLFCRSPHGVTDLIEQVLGRYPEARRLVEEELRGEAGGTMEIDGEKVLSHLRLLEADLRRLREKAALTGEDYLADLDAQDVVMRRFQTAIESCANIGNHLIARLRLRLAEDYATVFTILGEAGILSRELATRMTELARFSSWPADTKVNFGRARWRASELSGTSNAPLDRAAHRRSQSLRPS